MGGKLYFFYQKENQESQTEFTSWVYIFFINYRKQYEFRLDKLYHFGDRLSREGEYITCWPDEIVWGRARYSEMNKKKKSILKKWYVQQSKWIMPLKLCKSDCTV